MSQKGRPSAGILNVSFPEPTQASIPGLQRLGLGNGTNRDGLLYLPQGAPDAPPRPLIVLLHGAGGDAASTVNILLPQAERLGLVLLLPESRHGTWDFLIDGFGPDVRFIERAIEHTAARCRIDRSRVALAGFSDGASYALTLGLINGELFTGIIAFSPGFMAPTRTEDSPRVYISHGTRDAVLSITRCSRRLVPLLEQAGYDVTYHEFEGPHTVPAEIVDEAMDWFLSRRK